MNEESLDLEGFNLIMDVSIPIMAELDHRTISFNELVNLDVETIVPLSRPSGENIELFVGDVLLATGEIVVNSSKLGVRVAEVSRTGRDAHTSTFDFSRRAVERIKHK